MQRRTEFERRLDRLCAQAGRPSGRSLLAELEDTLSEGYARALSAERRLRQLDRRLESLIEVAGDDGGEIRSAARERREIGATVARLRSQLEVLQASFTALRERSASASARR